MKINNLKEKIINNKIFKALIMFLTIIVFTYLFLIPNTLINAGYFVYGLFIFIAYLIIYIVKRIIKKQKIKIEFNKKDIIKLIINSLMMGIFINSAFFILLEKLSPELAYTYSFGNFEAYRNATTWVYLLITIIILPLFDNLLLRRLIGKFKNEKFKIAFSIILSIFVLSTSATYISGLYLMIINLGLNLIYIKNKSLKQTFLIESCIAFTLSSMTLWLSPYKTVVILLMLVISFSAFILNLKETQILKNI